MSFDLSQLGDFRCVFDVGADSGEFAVEALRAWPGCRVLSFEPLHPGPTVNRTGGALGQWTWHQLALGSSADTRQMDVCEFPPSSSLLAMADLHKQAFPYTAATTGSVTVQIVRLDTFAALIVAPALLKLDVQGYELEVLRGAGQALARFAAVVVEVNHQVLYHGAPSPKALGDYLGAAGFVHGRRLEELRHPETDVLLQSDELWVQA